MPAGPDALSTTNSNRDQLEGVDPPIEAPYFDAQLRAWVLSRHADLQAAFHESDLAPGGGGQKQPAELADDTSRKMREETREALSPSRLREWRESMHSQTDSLARRLPSGTPLELMDVFARPLCLTFAALVTGISVADAERLDEFARTVSGAAADPDDVDLSERAKDANARLREHFHSGPEPLRDSGFVALSQTLPCMLGNAWHALAQHPDQWRLLHLHPEMIEPALEELLRYAGTVRRLKRTATADMELNGCPVRKGQRVLMRVDAANRDPERFSHPDQFDCTRRDAGHFTFGAGAHSCVGANLIRMAVKTITGPLVQRFPSVRAVRPVEWRGGSVFRFPTSLWVSLEER